MSSVGVTLLWLGRTRGQQPGPELWAFPRAFPRAFPCPALSPRSSAARPLPSAFLAWPPAEVTWAAPPASRALREGSRFLSLLGPQQVLPWVPARVLLRPCLPPGLWFLLFLSLFTFILVFCLFVFFHFSLWWLFLCGSFFCVFLLRFGYSGHSLPTPNLPLPFLTRSKIHPVKLFLRHFSATSALF